MSSFADPQNVKAAIKAGDSSSKLAKAIAPIVSDTLIQGMEQEQKKNNAAKKTEESQNPSSFN
jgi:hypothetical protein